MDLAEIIETVADRKRQIEDKYGKMMKKIDDLEAEISSLETKYKHNTKQFIEAKRKIIQSKIDTTYKIAEQWKTDQLKKVEDWLVSQENKIKKKSEDWIKDLNERREQFRLKKNNNNSK